MGLNRKLRRQAFKLQGRERDEFIETQTINASCSRAVTFWQSITFLALHDEFGFGAGRLKQFNDKMNELADCVEKGTVRIDEIQRFIECGFDEQRYEHGKNHQYK